VEALLNLGKGDEARVALGLFVSVVLLESLAHNLGGFVDFVLKQGFKQIRLHHGLRWLCFGQHAVALQKHLDRSNAVRDKLRPRDLAIWVLVRQRQKNFDVLLRQIVVLQLFKCAVEFSIREFAGILGISSLQNLDQGAFQRLDKAG